MYQSHFGLLQEPFSIAPDPAFLFLSDAHNEALAHLMYGFAHGGFVLITGEVGTGKTTLLRNLLNRTPPELDVAFILNPRLTVRELLETLCDELGVPYDREATQTVKQFIDVLNKHLLLTHQSGRSTVMIIDEAQNLSPAVLEQIRLLTNLETNDKKLLRIILLGQPELAEMLERKELRQLAQRITARYHLTPLSKKDVYAYVSHRLARAGGNPNIFTKSALNTLYRLSKGTPRLINIIADRALLGAYVEGKYQVTPKLVRNGASEVLGESYQKRQYKIAAGGVVLSLLVVFAGWLLWNYVTPDTAASKEIASQTQKATSPNVAIPAVAPANPTSAISNSRQTQSTKDAGTDASANPAAAQTDNRDSATTTQTPTRLATQTSNVNASASPAVTISRPSGRTFVNRRRAYQAVFAAWGADYPVDSAQIPCDFAPTVGLQCLSRKGGWSEINALNTPVVLELWDEQSAPYYAAITQRSGNQYTLVVGDNNTIATPRDLRDAWFGAYVLLWQTPPQYKGSLRQGDNHPTVRWLHARLLELLPDAELGAPQTNFSPSLRTAVIQFQQDEGLLADGIVGPLTWIRLSDRLNLPAPKLDS